MFHGILISMFIIIFFELLHGHWLSSLIYSEFPLGSLWFTERILFCLLFIGYNWLNSPYTNSPYTKTKRGVGAQPPSFNKTERKTQPHVINCAG